MKPEELIQSLDYVGEDLLMESENTVRIRRKRPWAGAAAAAVLALAVGIGGFVLLKHTTLLPAKDPTGENGGPENTGSTVQMTDITDVTNPQSEKLTVGDNYKGISDRSFPDLEAVLAANPWQAVNQVPAPDRVLPVYENLAWHREMPIPAYYDAATLTQKLLDAAKILGLELQKDPVVHYWKPSDAEESNGIPYQCQAGTDQGTLMVLGDGSVMMEFDEAHIWRPGADQITVEGPAGLSEEQRALAQRQAAVQAWAEHLQPMLQMPDYGIAAPGYLNTPDTVYYAYGIYPIRKDPIQQLLSYHFEQVRLLANDDWSLWGFVIPEGLLGQDLDPAGNCRVPGSLVQRGDYRIIDADRASALVKEGSYLTEADLSKLTWNMPSQSVGQPAVSPSLPTQHRELVYLTETQHQLLLPFYRFWIQTGQGEDSGDYIAVYVPAVQSVNLEDFPITRIELPFATGNVDPDLLPALPMSECFDHDGSLPDGGSFTDPAAELALSPWRNGSPQVPESLPVFRNRAYVDAAGQAMELSREELEERGQKAAELLGLTVEGRYWYQDTILRDGDTVTLPYLLQMKAAGALISVEGSGAVGVRFDEPVSLAAYVKADPSPGRFGLATADAYGKLWAGFLARFSGAEDARLQSACTVSYDASGAGSWRFVWWEAAPDGSAVEELIRYSFAGSFQLDAQGRLQALQFPGQARENIGQYPAISWEDADRLLAEDRYLSMSTELAAAGIRGESLLKRVSARELIYRCSNAERYSLPFYRYWIELPRAESTAGSRKNYTAVYVPAIHDAWLTDAPADRGGAQAGVLRLREILYTQGKPEAEIKIFRDIDKEMVLSPWNEALLEGYPKEWHMEFPKALPVLRNQARPGPDGESWVQLTREEIEQRLRDEAGDLASSEEAVLWSDAGLTEADEAGVDRVYPAWGKLSTQLGTLTCYGNGVTEWVYTTPLERMRFLGEQPYFPEADPNDSNWAEFIAGWEKALSDSEDEPSYIAPACEITYDTQGNVHRRWFYWGTTPEPHEAALSYSLSPTEMELDAAGNLKQIRYGRPDTAPDFSSYVQYPIVTRQEADELFRSGYYITACDPASFPEADRSGEALLAGAAKVEMIYRAEGVSRFLPFYRYWVALDSSDLPHGLTRYGAFYVPAIQQAYLADYPKDLMPAMQ